MDWSWVYRRVGGEGVDKEVASSFVSSNESYRYRWLLKRNWSYQPADAIEFIASVILQRATRPKKKKNYPTPIGNVCWPLSGFLFFFAIVSSSRCSIHSCTRVASITDSSTTENKTTNKNNNKIP